MARPLRVAFDVRMAGSSGIGTYVDALVEQFSRDDSIDLRPVRSRARIYSLREQLTVPLRGLGADVFHAPQYNAPLAVPSPLVVTIHDVAHIALPEVFRSRAMQAYAHAMLRGAIARARLVLTGSEFTRDELVRRLGADPGRMRSISYGVDPRFRPAEDFDAVRANLRDMGIEGPYVLYVGNVKAHKNLTGLIAAFERLPDPQLRLIIAGTVGGFRVGDDAVYVALARSPARDRIRATGWVDDDQLLALYQGARLLAIPSLYEGYGLPVVEAMACGVPVVTSDRASLPEAAGGAAVLVDPADTDGFADAIARVDGDEALRADLVSRGLRRVRELTWEESARRHVEVYREAAGR